MKSLQKFTKILLTATLIVGLLSSCDSSTTIISPDSRQTIPYSESCMAAFSKEFKNSSEIYVESDNGKQKTAIDPQSGNSYEEVTRNGETQKMYFLNQSSSQVPSGVYELFEKNNIHCFYPIEGDFTVSVYELLADMGSTNINTVDVRYDGVNRVETISNVLGGTMTVVFWGDTPTPIGAGRNNDMENFMLTFNVITNQIPNAEMKKALKNGLNGYSLYIPPNPYL